MTSKLPVRRNIAPLFKIADELENHLDKSLKAKNTKFFKTFSANFNGAKESKAKGKSKPEYDCEAEDKEEQYDKVTKKKWVAMVS